MNATAAWRIENHKWTKDDATAAAARFIAEPTEQSARLCLSVLSYASMPKPFLRCDDLGNDATTADDLDKLNRNVMAFLKVR